MVSLHDRVADGGDALQEVLRVFRSWARQWLDENDARIRSLVAGVEALDSEGHDGHDSYCKEDFRFQPMSAIFTKQER